MFQGRSRTLVTQSFLGEGSRTFSANRTSNSGLGVVAIHGFTGTAAELRPVLERLADRGHAVDGAVLPGHGTRATDLQDTTYETWAAAVRQRTRAAVDRYERVVLLGFSLGSLLAMQIASEALQDPLFAPSVAGLVVLGNALTLHWHSALPLALVDRSRQAMPDVYLLKPRAGDLVDSANMGRLVTYDRHPMRAALEVFRAGSLVRAAVNRITCPTLVLHGRRDHVCPWSNAPWLAHNLGTRAVTVRLFEKSAHVLAWDVEREDVAAEIATFVDHVAQRS